MRLRLLAVLALAVGLLSGCGYNQIQTNDEQVERRLVRSAQPVQAPCRPGAEPGGHRAGLRRPRTRGADPGDAGARQCGRHEESRRNWSTIPRPSPSSRRRRPTCPAPCRACWWWRRTIRSSRRTPISAICRRRSKVPRTASPWRATATSRRCRKYNTTVRIFPNNLTAMIVRLQDQGQLHRRGREGDVGAAVDQLRATRAIAAARPGYPLIAGGDSGRVSHRRLTLCALHS